MKLHSLTMEGFRKHLNTTVYFSDSTFLLGENNVGKSSVLCALKYLLEKISDIPDEEYYATSSDGERITIAQEIVLTAEFRDIPPEAEEWKGFKGRLLKYETDGEETGLRFVYRKTFPRGGKAKIETLENKKTIKEEFNGFKNICDLLTAGLDESELPDELVALDRNKSLTKKQRDLAESIEAIYDYEKETEEWFENPGGIPGIVMSRLPKLLLIPAQDKEEEISGKSGVLQATLGELFNEVRDSSENYKKAQKYLDELAKELDTSDDNTEISKMIKELNEIISEVFPHSGINAVTDLSDADSVIKPMFEIRMNSNVTTPSSLQGTGLIRSTVFALLRYKALRDNRRGSDENRQLIIGFEEPEIYLHPNAIVKMRDTIYSLAETGRNQIVCTTHSPYMIDISKEPKQILNSLYEEMVEGEAKGLAVKNVAFNVTDEFQQLLDDDKDYIKMVLRLEDGIAKSFFVKNVLIVEGDTEQVVLTETIKRLPKEMRNDVQANWYILRARGKAAIISLVKYLKAMQINVFVMHDKDSAKEGAVKFNDPIKNVLNNDKQLFVLEECVEDVLGYDAPSSNKPFHAYKYIQENWKDWNTVSEEWKKVVERLFNNGEVIIFETSEKS